MSKISQTLSALLLAAAGLLWLPKDITPPDPRLNHIPVRSNPFSQPCLIRGPSQSIEQIINFYERIIAEDPKCEEQAVKALGDYYGSLIFENHGRESAGDNKKYISQAINFYVGIIRRHPNSQYLAEAHLNSGLIWCYVEPREIERGILQLMAAKDITNNKLIKAQALYHLGAILLENPEHGDNPQSYKTAKRYLMKAIEFAAGSYFGERAKQSLQDPRFRDIK